MSDPTPQFTPQWAAPPPVYGYAQPGSQPPTNGLAIAAMVVSIVAVIMICAYGVGSVIFGPIGAILGHVARRQIKQKGEQGDGMAIAGIIVGWVGFAVGLLVVAAIVVFFVWVGSLPSDTTGDGSDWD